MYAGGAIGDGSGAPEKRSGNPGADGTLGVTPVALAGGGDGTNAGATGTTARRVLSTAAEPAESERGSRMLREGLALEAEASARPIVPVISCWPRSASGFAGDPFGRSGVAPTAAPEASLAAGDSGGPGDGRSAGAAGNVRGTDFAAVLAAAAGGAGPRRCSRLSRTPARSAQFTASAAMMPTVAKLVRDGGWSSGISLNRTRRLQAPGSPWLRP
jgi:hypothetical protein